jgi:glycosyltransferase involved in cell wall biosynthesis
MLPLGAIRHLGVQTHYSNELREPDWTVDVIVAQRPVLPGPTKIIDRIVRSKGERPKIVVELDDDLLNVDAHNKVARRLYWQPEIQANLKKNIAAADLITVSTEQLAEAVRPLNSNVVVLENCIPEQMLSWQAGCYNDRFTIGWQGSPTHEGDWQVAAQPVQRWFNQAKKGNLAVEMHTVGDVPKSFPQIYPHRISSWRQSIEEYYRVLDWHVALAPLSNSKFNTSKSHIRALEAAMLGFPVIASDVPAYSDFVQDGQTGFLVRKPADWGTALQSLALDPAMREEMAAAARKHAAAYTIEQNAHKWLEAYAA